MKNIIVFNGIIEADAGEFSKQQVDDFTDALSIVMAKLSSQSSCVVERMTAEEYEERQKETSEVSE